MQSLRSNVHGSQFASLAPSCASRLCFPRTLPHAKLSSAFSVGCPSISLQRPMSVAARSSNEITSPRLANFFNRKREMVELQELCSSPPMGISVLLGPRDTGKTSLLRAFVDLTGEAGCCSYISFRDAKMSSPALLAQALLSHSLPTLLQQSDSWPVKRFTTLLSFVSKQVHLTNYQVTIEGKEFAAALQSFATGPDASKLSLTHVIQAYNSILDQWEEDGGGGKLPVLILDEANVLMEWSSSYEDDLKALLRFFIATTKERNRGHVILATSEYLFHEWLFKRIGPSFCQTYVVGDFNPKEARAFVDFWLGKFQKPVISDADWDVVFKVCGGNAGALRYAVIKYKGHGNWKCGYTKADFAKVVKAILESKHKAVDETVLVNQVGVSQETLDNMVRANQVALRSYSRWASDMAPEAFGCRERALLITAPTPVHLYLMEDEKELLLEPLKAIPPQLRKDKEQLLKEDDKLREELLLLRSASSPKAVTA